MKRILIGALLAATLALPKGHAQPPAGPEPPLEEEEGIAPAEEGLAAGEPRGAGGPGRHGPKQLEAALSAIRRYDPGLADKLEEIRAENPRVFQMILRRAHPVLAAVRRNRDEEAARKAVRTLRLEIQRRSASERVWKPNWESSST